MSTEYDQKTQERQPPSRVRAATPAVYAQKLGATLATPVKRSAGLLTMWFGSPVRPDTARFGTSLAPAGTPSEVRCILSLASALLGYGLSSHRVEEAVLRLARAFGRQASVFGLPTALTITLRGSEGVDMYVVRAEPGTIDLGRLDALHHLVAQVERGELDAPSAEREVTTILQAPRAVPRWVDLAAVALVGFGGTLMLGGRPLEATFAALLAFGVGLVLSLASTHTSLGRVMPLAASVLVTLSSAGLAHARLVDHPLVVATAALLVLLPGLMLTLAMTELATGHLVSGTARSMGAVVVLLQLGLGVLFGVRLGRLQDVAVALLPPAPLAPAAAGAFLLALGFSVLLAMRLRDWHHTLFVSALSFFVCRFVGESLGTEIGVLTAATAVGLYSHAFARRNDRPSSTLTLPGVLMLVPGSLGLMTVSAAALDDPTRAFQVGSQLVLILVALSSGILFSAAALPPRTEL